MTGLVCGLGLGYVGLGRGEMCFCDIIVWEIVFLLQNIYDMVFCDIKYGKLCFLAVIFVI